MPIYVYQCLDCASKYTEEELMNLDKESYESNILFETYHSFNPSEQELKENVVCPRCKSNHCVKTYTSTTVSGYVRGYGWKDYAGARRDMNVYHLDNDDPYKPHRVEGEVEHIRSRIKKQNKHDPNTKFFTT
jgi:DNA-directed RNA polymerase subunit RPC12/RpoP